MLQFNTACHCSHLQLQFSSANYTSTISHSQSLQTIHATSQIPLISFTNTTPTFISGSLKDCISYISPNKNEHFSCKKCATTVYTKTNTDKISYLVPLSTFVSPNHGNNGTLSPSFVPTCHTDYKEGILSSFDNLPKYTSNLSSPTLPNNIHGRSKPTEEQRNCLVESNGHYNSLLKAYATKKHATFKNTSTTHTSSDVRQNKCLKEKHMVQCSCSNVKLEIYGSPDWTANCHCSVCRILHGTSYVSMCGYSSYNFNYPNSTKKEFEQKTIMYNCNGKSMEDRYACKSCGSWVMTNMKHLKCHAFFLPNISQTDGRFKPSCHIFYSSGITNVWDDLPKFYSFPPSLGGCDRAMLPNDYRNTTCCTMPWKEAKGTMVLGILSLVCLLTTSVWGRVSQTKKLYMGLMELCLFLQLFFIFFD